MYVGLIDVDGHNGFPNLALMRISAYHKAKGDNVMWYSPIEYGENNLLDRVYMSKVFTFEPDYQFPIYAKEVIRGGTGYKNYDSLPTEIETMFPDYSLYPDFKQAIGFLTRGCVRSCPWCVVPKKEGKIRPSSTWHEIKRCDSEEIIFLDNNVLACDHGLSQIEEMGHYPIKVDFNQGLDARLITPHIASLLARLKWIRFVRLSCDTAEMLPIIEQATAYMREAGIKSWRFWAYMLVEDDVEEAEKRAIALHKMNVVPFAQPYRDYSGGEPTQRQKDLARWVNHRATFESCSFSEYRNGARTSRRAEQIGAVGGKEDEGK